nr:twin-arginine translocase subunit TatC [Alkalibaculum sporogenes]
MSLIEHLTDLRKCLIIVIICFFIASLISFNFVQFFIDQLISLAVGYNFVYISPSELIMQYIKVALLVAIVATSPIILYQIWKFVCPGLKTREKVTMFFAFLSGFVFFCIGLAFSFFIVIPIMLQFFLTIDTTHVIEPMITIANYISFISSNLIIFGAIFEMPIITIVLTQLGLLKPQWLVKSRAIVAVVIFVIGAIITPPDVVSQILVAIPMLILYELSVVVCKLLEHRKRKRKKKLDLDDD